MPIVLQTTSILIWSCQATKGCICKSLLDQQDKKKDLKGGLKQ
jgi:hypothetical protein